LNYGSDGTLFAAAGPVVYAYTLGVWTDTGIRLPAQTAALTTVGTRLVAFILK
jgi:hypothetical protein